MITYETVVEALNDLKERGYSYDFNLSPTCLVCGEGIQLQPTEFDIVEVHRFEGMTDPADSSIVYAIESHHGMKGTLIDAYGAYSDSLSADMVKKLAIVE
jgi:hypothetical protein